MQAEESQREQSAERRRRARQGRLQAIDHVDAACVLSRPVLDGDVDLLAHLLAIPAPQMLGSILIVRTC